MPSAAQLVARYLLPYRKRTALLGVCLLGSVGLQLYIPQIMRRFIDAASGATSASVLGPLALAFLGLALANQALSVASTYLSADIGWSTTNALRADLFRHAIGLDMAYHKDRTPGEMIERIDGDVSSVANLFSQFVVRVSSAALMTVGVLVLLWREDWRVGLVLTIFTAAAARILHWRRSIAVAPTREEREASAQLFGFIEERLTGIDDIRANGAGGYVMHRFLQVQRGWFAKALHAWWLRSTIWLSMGVMFATGYVITLSLGIGLYLRGAVTLGTVYLFFNYMAMLEAPLDQITNQLQEFQRAAAGIRRVRELLEAGRSVLDGSRRLVPAAHSVAFADVRFSYSGSDARTESEVLKGISFRLDSGETLGLIGRTGSGKTTLVRLLFRLYDASSGRISLDDLDLKNAAIEPLRRRIGLVTQDVQLFHGTVRDNITFFDRTIPDDRIHSVIGRLGIASWLKGLRQGLDTRLEAGGAGLSAGESQLLAFARVFLKNPGLVILDEPSSRLDPATERLLTGAVNRLLEGRTGIIIAHRLETVERVDKIMVLADGRIVEYGPRAALAADPASCYSGLIRLSAGQELDAALDVHLERLAE